MRQPAGSIGLGCATWNASLVSWALKTNHDNRSRAAALLGIKRSTLADRIQRCGLGVVASAARAGLTPAGAS